MKRIGKKLYALRKHHGLTINQLAKELQISNAQISRIENGIHKPSGELILRIADFFGVDVNQLMRDELEVE